MGLREIALKELARRGAGKALRERAAIDRALWAAAPTERARLAARRQEVSVALEGAVREVASSLPPLEIVLRVEAVVEACLRLLQASIDAPSTLGPVTAELGAIADRVHAIWAPDADLARAVEALGAVGSRAAPPGPLRGHPMLVFAPMSEEELVARARAVLADTAWQLDAQVEAERRDRDLALARIERVRSERGWIGRITSADFEWQQELEGARRAVLREERELSLAFERSWFARASALGVLPPLRIEQRARAAAAIAPLVPLDRSRVLLPGGRWGLTNLGGRRAMFLAALVELRATVDEVFPGLELLTSGEAGLVEALLAAEGVVTASRDEPVAPPTRTSDGDFDAVLDAAGVPAILRRGVTHGAALGALHRAAQGDAPSRERGLWAWLGLRAAADPLEPRIALHAGEIEALSRELHASLLRPELPGAAIHEGLAAIVEAASRLRVDLGRPNVPSGVRELEAAIDRCGGILSQVLGVPASLDALAATVGRRIQLGVPSGSPLVEGLARELARTPFPDLAVELEARASQAVALRAELKELDPHFGANALLPFGADSARREALTAALAAAESRARELRAACAAALEVASARFPWLQVLGGLEIVRFAARRVRTFADLGYDRIYASDRIAMTGNAELLDALGRLVAAAQSAGAMLSQWEALERLLRARLAARRPLSRPALAPRPARG